MAINKPIILSQSTRRFLAELTANFVVGLTATLIGVYIALDLTLEADRNKQDAIAKKHAAEKHQIDSIYHVKVLSLIRKELVECQSGLVFRQEEVRQVRIQYLSARPLANSFWKAIVNGGGLERIRDLDLLDAISRAYKDIDYIIFLEETQMERATPGGSIMFNQQFGNIRAKDKEIEVLPRAARSIRIAIQQIDGKLITGYSSQ